MVGLSYNGQPVYREWTVAKDELNFFSREIKQLGFGKGWKLVRLVPLLSTKISLKLSSEKRMRKAVAAEMRLLKIEGVVRT